MTFQTTQLDKQGYPKAAGIDFGRSLEQDLFYLRRFNTLNQ